MFSNLPVSQSSSLQAFLYPGMDSGNSSSMLSSKGPDDDVDSKVESSMSMPSPVPLFLDHHALSLSNYYNLNNTFLPSSLMSEPDYLPHTAYSSQPQPQQNPAPSTHLHLDTFCPDPNCTGLGGLPASSSLSPRQTMLVPQGLAQVQQYPPSLSSGTTTSQPTKVAKNPRKRTRASRRAPTTVLNTDTSNFRAMVQEFTGFPAPPFSGSRNLDLFEYGLIFRSGHHSHDPLGKMLPQRPSAKKLQQPPLMADSGDPNSNARTNCVINNALMSTITTSIAQLAANADLDNFPISPLLNLPKHPSRNHQNPITVPNSNILTTFPSLKHDHDPIDTPMSGWLYHFDGNSDPSSQDQLGIKWDGLQARFADMAKTNNIGHENSRPSKDELYCGGTQRAKMNRCKRRNYSAAGSQPSTNYHRHNNEKGFENRVTVDNWFGPSD